jgi:aminoglycoside phosphotransferase family enzyme/predicted kinase
MAETHVSVVMFLGDRAYKVKKPVKTAFLDYSTRAAREAICHREVELNRRLAPDVYLGVIDLIGPDRNPCDHLVAMQRMPAERRLATLVRDGKATADMITAIARTMASFHSRADRGAAIEATGTPDAVRRLWADNFDEMTPFTRWLLPPETLAMAEAMAFTYLDGREPLFWERIVQGRIVDGHGDLLAEDIFCLDDGPRTLDCLEFDDRLRCGDVLLDIGFLAMDLERLGRPDLARSFLDAYRELSAETHPRSLEHHYMAYRALVRAKIACLLAADRHTAAASQAMALLDLCARHLQQSRVRLVLVGGTPGTGKTTLAEALAACLGSTLLRSDELRKEQAGIPSMELAAVPFGEGIYTATTTKRMYEELARRAEVALARGETVILDATWDSAPQRVLAVEAARRTHSELVEFCCECPATVADQRIASRSAGGGDASDATPDVAARLRAHFVPWPSAHRVDTSRRWEDALSLALRSLGSPASNLRSRPNPFLSDPHEDNDRGHRRLVH